MPAVEFFTYACDALAANPPHATDFSVLARIANFGIVAGERFDASALDGDVLDAIEAGASAAQEAIAGNDAGFGTEVNGSAIATETMASTATPT